MRDEYPIPSAAAYVWTAGDKLYLALPGDAGRGHTVVIPLDNMKPDTGKSGAPLPEHRGFAVFLGTLRQREMAAARPMIGERGALPKHSIASAVESDEKYKLWLDAMTRKKEKKAEVKQSSEAMLRELGLL